MDISERSEQRSADMEAILKAQLRLRVAKRTLHLVNLKKARRIARVQTALRNLEEIISEVETAQDAVKDAQQINDRAYLTAAQHTLESGSPDHTIDRTIRSYSP